MGQFFKVLFDSDNIGSLSTNLQAQVTPCMAQWGEKWLLWQYPESPWPYINQPPILKKQCFMIYDVSLTYLSSSGLSLMEQNWPRPLARGGIDRWILPTLGETSPYKLNKVFIFYNNFICIITSKLIEIWAIQLLHCNGLALTWKQFKPIVQSHS